MTSLRVTVPETVDVAEIVDEIVIGVTDRLRDEHGYRLIPETSATAGSHEYPLRPSGSIVVEDKAGALKVRLKGLDVDAHDLFTGVSSELEQRHEGLRVEIG